MSYRKPFVPRKVWVAANYACTLVRVKMYESWGYAIHTAAELYCKDKNNFIEFRRQVSAELRERGKVRKAHKAEAACG